jgi:putative transposase
VLVLEDLNVSGMTRNHHLAKSILDAGMGELARQIVYKAYWHGVEVRVANRFFPSAKTCSGCGEINMTLNLSQRVYSCGSCDLTIDRDLNAAINIARCTSKVLAPVISPVPTRALLLAKS